MADHIDEGGKIRILGSKSAFETDLIQSSENIFLQLVYNILDNSPRGPGSDNLIDSSGKRKYFVSFFFSDKYKWWSLLTGLLGWAVVDGAGEGEGGAGSPNDEVITVIFSSISNSHCRHQNTQNLPGRECSERECGKHLYLSRPPDSYD